MEPVLPLHLGSLHPIEQALTLLLAFGPLVVLALVIRHQRQEPEAEELAGEPLPGEVEQTP
ncbi:hypothetical protein GCM10027020_16240 [Nocardioides salsibiostraticola]